MFGAVLVLLACSPTATPSPVPQTAPRTCETAELISETTYAGVIFPSECAKLASFPSWPGEVTGYWSVSAVEIALLESRVQSALQRAEQSPQIFDRAGGNRERAEDIRGNLAEIIPHLEEYGRQYLGIIVRGNHRRVLINFFRSTDDHPYWRDTWVTVDDGGTDYWRVQFDVASGTFVEFDCNGEA